jgi:hypothetical protein
MGNLTQFSPNGKSLCALHRGSSREVEVAKMELRAPKAEISSRGAAPYAVTPLEFFTSCSLFSIIIGTSFLGYTNTSSVAYILRKSKLFTPYMVIVFHLGFERQ